MGEHMSPWGTAKESLDTYTNSTLYMYMKHPNNKNELL